MIAFETRDTFQERAVSLTEREEGKRDRERKEGRVDMVSVTHRHAYGSEKIGREYIVQKNHDASPSFARVSAHSSATAALHSVRSQ
jgi:hypothetical protein